VQKELSNFNPKIALQTLKVHKQEKFFGPDFGFLPKFLFPIPFPSCVDIPTPCLPKWHSRVPSPLLEPLLSCQRWLSRDVCKKIMLRRSGSARICIRTASSYLDPQKHYRYRIWVLNSMQFIKPGTFICTFEQCCGSGSARIHIILPDPDPHRSPWIRIRMRIRPFFRPNLEKMFYKWTKKWTNSS